MWFFFSCGYAQTYRHFDMNNGLPSTRIYKIIQDNEGFIWMATDNGLVKFDGRDFRVFTVRDGLPTNDIWDIIQTRDGKIWYMSKAPRLGYVLRDSVYACGFEGHDDVVYPVPYTDRNQMIYMDIITGENFYCKDTLWRKKYFPKKTFSILHPRYNKVTWEYRPESYGFGSEVTGDSMLVLGLPLNPSRFRQINDSLLFLTGHMPDSAFRIVFFNLNRRQYIPMAFSLDAEQVFRLRAFASDRDIQLTTENFWVSIGPGFRITDSLRLKNFPYKWRAFRDRDGHFWIYTYNNGAFYMRRHLLHNRIFFADKAIRFLKPTGLGITASVLREGVFYFDPALKKFVSFYPSGIHIHDVYIRDKNHYLISTTNKLIFHWNGQHKEKKASPGKIFYHDGRFYVMDFRGIHVYDTLFHYLHMSPAGAMEAMEVFQDRLLVGGSSGLYEWGKGGKIFRLFGNAFRKPVLSLYATDKHLFIGTAGNGLYRWDGKKAPVRVGSDPAENINGMTYDGRRLWVATQKGITVYHPMRDSLHRVFILRRADGLPSDQIIDLALSNGKLFAASYSGISVMDARPPMTNTIGRIYWKKISYGGKKLVPGRKIPYQKNAVLTVSFGIIDFTGRRHNRYAYRLRPLQNEWAELNGQTVSISHLSPGKYTFEVRALNPYGQAMVKKFSFGIRPLWWQRPAAKTGGLLLLFMLLAGMVYCAWRYDIRRNRRKWEIRRKMTEHELHALRSQMNPHFIFNSLNAIQYYISDENFDKSEEYLIKFSRLIRMIFDFSRKKDIPLNDEIKLLKSYTELEKMRFGDRLQVVFKVDPDLDLLKTTIPTMLLQPVVENAINHGIFHKRGPGKVVIEFARLNNETFMVKVCDDGVGIRKAEEIKRKSLRKHLSRAGKILAERIKLLNQSGKWKIDYRVKDLTQAFSEYSTCIIMKIKKL